MEGVYAAFKAALVPVNVNYRYREEELRYLLDNADAEIVIVHEDFVPLLGKVIGRLPQIKGVLVVDGDARTAPTAARRRTTTRPSPRPIGRRRRCRAAATT